MLSLLPLNRPRLSAAIVDDALVVRVTGPAPRLWRAPASALATATLLVETSTDKDTPAHHLVFVSANGREEIARFASAKDAERAFLAVSDQLLSGRSNLVAKKRPFLARAGVVLVKAVIWVLFLWMVAVIASYLFLNSRGIETSLPSSAQKPAASTPAPASSAPADGVAVPADQLFNKD